MVLVDFAQTCLFVRFRYIISKIIISLTNQLDISRMLHILKTYVPCKVVSREINHSINCMYYTPCQINQFENICIHVKLFHEK